MLRNDNTNVATTRIITMLQNFTNNDACTKKSHDNNNDAVTAITF